MILLNCVAAPVLAQPAGQGVFSGSVALGTRSVEVAGAETKYREDINLDDGLRLFDLALDYRANGADAPVDDFTLRASGLGGDPYESIRLSARRYGAYRLQLDRQRSDYFYADTILPAALASVNGVTGGDFHLFDFERVRDTASLDLDLSPATRLRFGLERQTRSGNSTTTQTVSRDEFEFDKPLDESLERLSIGVEHDFERVTVMFEEALGTYDNTSELFLPGASPGANVTSNPAELQYFFLDQFYDYDSRSHLLRAVAEPTERLRLTGFWRSEDLDLDQQVAEQSAGTDFNGAPLATDRSGAASVGRDLDLGGVDFGFALGERARLVGGVRSSRLEQDGLGMFGTDINEGRWTIDTDSFELGGEIVFGQALVLTVGRSTETRDTEYEERHSTDRSGYFARVNWRNDGLSLQASVDDNSIDDPFALAAPTDARRIKFSARYAWDSGIWVQGSARRSDVENSNSGWLADTEQADLRLGYRRERLELSAGVSDTNIDRQIDQLVTAGSVQALFPAAYDASMRLRDVWLRWAASERIAIGGSFGSYDNSGSFALERDDHRVWLDYALSDDYSLLATYRDIDFAEASFDSYDADIFELALRLDW